MKLFYSYIDNIVTLIGFLGERPQGLGELLVFLIARLVVICLGGFLLPLRDSWSMKLTSGIIHLIGMSS